MATAKRAETAQELREKYRRKRMTVSTASQYYLYNYLYWMYLSNEGKQEDYLKDKMLNDDTSVVTTLSDDYSAGGNGMAMVRIYGELCEWLNSSFESAVLMRNALADYIRLFYREFATILAVEGLETELGNHAKDEKIASFLNLLAIDAKQSNPQSCILLLRQRIKRNLCYLNAYNTLIAMIAKQIKVPELTFLQVEMDGVVKGIDHLNEAMEKFIVEAEQPCKLFREISNIAPPIPKENIHETEQYIKTILSATSNLGWSGAFRTISKNYWRR